MLKFFAFIVLNLSCSLLSFAATPPPQLKIPADIWQQLSSDEKNAAATNFSIEVVMTESLGRILDVQSVDRSTQASNAGSQLGSAYAQANYIDKSFDNGNYSATGQLNSALLGAAVGSLLNSSGERKFKTRYTIKRGDGQMEYLIENSAEEFTHTKGLCVSFSPIRIVEDYVCTLTKTDTVALISDPSIYSSIVGNTQNKKQTQKSKDVKCKTNDEKVTILSRALCSKIGTILE